jgi:arylsulfatase A-like enzyme
MRTINVLQLFLLLLTISGVNNSCSAKNKSKLNVLFITIDDLNDWSTVFDKNNPIKTPNLEKLASRGAFFNKAYCSSPACNPSRASVMTGTRPHKTGIYGNASDWRGTLPGIPTIQKYFKR